jgi:hypothetical protein
MTIHQPPSSAEQFPTYIFETLPLDDKLWTVVGVLGIGGKPSRGEVVAELLLAPADWRQTTPAAKPRTLTIEVGLGWTAALLPVTCSPETPPV